MLPAVIDQDFIIGAEAEIPLYIRNLENQKMTNFLILLLEET